MNISELAKSQDVQSILFIQMWSMRSHKTGKYILTMDGNFNATLHEMYNMKDSVKEFIVTKPAMEQTDEDSYIRMHGFLCSIFGPTKVQFVDSNFYGENAYETRKELVKDFSEVETIIKNTKADLTICDFELPHLSEEVSDLVYRFNIGYHAQFHLESMKEFENLQVDCCNTSATIFLQNLLHKERLSDLCDTENVVISRNWFNSELLKKQYEYFTKEIEITFPEADILFPFRLSDTEYNFDKFVRDNKDKTILVTDINNSYDKDYGNVVVLDPKIDRKVFFLYALMNSNYIIAYPPNPAITLHQTILEIMCAKAHFNENLKVLSDHTAQIEEMYQYHSLHSNTENGYELFDAIKSIREINESLLNDDDSKSLCSLEMHFDGSYMAIMFLGIRIWSTNDDERFFSETLNDYESFKSFLVRECNRILNNLKSTVFTL